MLFTIFRFLLFSHLFSFSLVSKQMFWTHSNFSLYWSNNKLCKFLINIYFLNGWRLTDNSSWNCGKLFHRMFRRPAIEDAVLFNRKSNHSGVFAFWLQFGKPLLLLYFPLRATSGCKVTLHHCGCKVTLHHCGCKVTLHHCGCKVTFQPQWLKSYFTTTVV
jgi:hypothetical protein